MKSSGQFPFREQFQTDYKLSSRPNWG